MSVAIAADFLFPLLSGVESMILSKVENNEKSKAKGTAIMDESVNEALSFNEEVEKGQNGKRRTVINASLAVVLAGSYFVMSQWEDDIPLWAFLGFMMFGLGAAMWVGSHQGDVRPSYRQDPFNQPEPDKKYYFGIFLMFAPTFFQTFLEGHMVIAAIVFTLWGVGVFWALNSGAMDMSTRGHEDGKQASGDE
ncbi:hypothetical protein [Corynebacterium tuberculostearicum]|uniref:hypothetical protein n=1 Tax=Corynebacterium tuberculostearicum TaxID=38304 RepID=UPI0017F72786|nr:hypothetical protein [Corynebacterium tuberculostearicum]NYI55287.1 hypothetical protein [Corynebacterium tuberculostearicum]